MSAAKWIPNDHELDALARSLPSPDQHADRAEQNRTRVLAAASNLAQKPRSHRGVWIAVAGLAVAAAAVLAIFLARRDASEPAKDTIAELRPSRFERGAWPAYRLAMHDGRLSVAVSGLDASDRFTLATADAELETRGARFVVDAERDLLAEVAVDAGVVELRVIGQRPVFLSAGQSWRATAKTAQLDVLTPAPTKPEPPTPAKTEPNRAVVTTRPTDPPRKAPAVEPKRPAVVAGPPDPSPEPKPPVAEPGPPSPKPDAPAKPGELEFRRGWTALRSGDAATAATAFKTACDLLAADTLGEDACYWAGVAARRAGRIADARAALTRFVQRFPSSARAGEASALLGWILYDANEIDAAERHFRRAASDRVPTVKASADKGMEAIARKRKQ